MNDNNTISEGISKTKKPKFNVQNLSLFQKS